MKRRKKIFLGYFLLLVGFFIVFQKISTPFIKSENLFFIKGQFENLHIYNGPRGYHDYSFKIKNYTNSFQIAADFLDIFDKINFATLDSTDEIILSIDKRDSSKLNIYEQQIQVYSLANDNETFLDSNQAIKKANSPEEYYIAGSIIILGAFFLYFENKSKKSSELQ
jgi:hypothetical protein